MPIESLPVPLMIEIESDRAALDRGGLIERLQAEAPGAVFDDHAAWRRRWSPPPSGCGCSRPAASGCSRLRSAAVLGLAAQAAVAANGGAIATLRLVGARDGFIRGAVTRRLDAAARSPARSPERRPGWGCVALLPRAASRGSSSSGIGLVGWHWLLPLAGPAGCGGDRLGRRRGRGAARPAALELRRCCSSARWSSTCCST